MTNPLQAATADGPATSAAKSHWSALESSFRKASAAIKLATVALLVAATAPREALAAAFTAGNLAVVQADASASNTTASVIELSPTTAAQTPSNTIAVGSGFRFSASATSTLYVANSNDGALLLFTGASSADTTSNVNTLTSRVALGVNAGGTVATSASYTGTSGNQTRSATTVNNTAFYIADQGGLYTNGSTSASPTGNLRAVKSFGGVVYVGQASATTTNIQVSTVSAPSGGTITGLPGLANNASHQDFCLISSGSNGTAFDVLYVISATSNTVGSIAKYSLVSGAWAANGTYTTTFGGFGITAKKSGAGAELYVTTGLGAATANSVLKVTDTAGYNTTLAVTTANNVTLYTAPTGKIVKGIAFAPVAAPTISGAATATAFTTTYGAPSAAQTFSISGSSLTANITATAPTGFEISSDGTSYGATATFTQASGVASGTLSIRLAATAAATGTSYNGKNIVLSSAGATDVIVATASSGNSVTPATLTITGITGGSKVYDGNTTATASGTATYSGLVNSESFSVTGTPSYTFLDANVGTAKTITISGFTAPSANYSLTQPTLTGDISAKSLTVTADSVTKPFGTALPGSVTGSTAFTSSGLVGTESIGSVTITYTAGTDANDPVGTYSGSIIPSAATGGTFSASNYDITYLSGSLTISAAPSITVSGTLSALSATYGSASTATTFIASGGNLTGNLTVTAPMGFEVSTDGTTYGATAPLAATSGSVSATTVYVRLTASATVGTYSGSVSVSGGGATSQSVSVPNSSVTTKNLTISGVSADSKIYDRSVAATLGGTPALVGVVGSDDVTVSGAPSASFATAAAGVAKLVAVSGYSLSGTAAGNYTVSQPTGLTATISPKELIVPDAVVTTKTFDGNTNATITGTLSGVISGDSVSFSGVGAFATAGPGANIAVTSNSTITGSDSANYALTQPTGLTGTITGSTNADLTNLTVSPGLIIRAGFGNFGPGFTSTSTSYLSFQSSSTTSITVTPTLSDANATVTVNGASPATAVTLVEGTNTITVLVTAQDATTTKVYTVTVYRSAPALGAGSVAVTGFDADGNDDIAFVALVDVPANSVIYLTDNEWNGQAIGSGGAFNDFNESEMVWVAPAGGVAAGSIVVLNNISGATPAANVGTVLYSDSANRGYSTTAEAVYLYQGATHLPEVFLAGITTDTAASFVNTGLSNGSTLVTLANSSDGGRYKGARNGQATFAGYLSLIGNVASNWDDIGGGDGTTYLPYSTTAFTVSGFDSLVSIDDVSMTEGDAGSKTFTFTVTRSNAAGAFTLDYATADGTATGSTTNPTLHDYSSADGTLNFTAGGSLTATVSITVDGDTTGETDETFFVNLSNIVNTLGTATFSDAQGLGTIVNDDPLPPAITTHPASTTIVNGATATLSVVATASPAPTYQWYQGASGVTTSPISGATSASFTTPVLTSTTSYWVRVTNTAGFVDSNTATVTVSGYQTPYSSASIDILTPNTTGWNPAGVTVNGTTFVNLGLQGVGRVPASAIDSATGESLGSISDMQITDWKKTGDGTYSGTFNFLPDRGYNNGAIFSNYATRLNRFSFTFTPYTASTPTTAQDQVVMTFLGSNRLTYDDGSGQKYTTGVLADAVATLFGGPAPVAAVSTTQADGTVANRLTVDAEGLVLDKRNGKSGSGWVSDEYGPYIYHFNSQNQIDGQVQLPQALIPHKPAGTTSFVDTNVNGRRTNQGMEGISQSPDGSKLFALMQSATLQDSASGNQGRFNTRLLVYDISTSDTPNDPVAQYLIQLPRVDSTGSTTNGSAVDRTAAQSSIVALNDHQILILSRDGNGRGSSGAPVFKSILLADINTGTNIDGTYDAEAAAVAPAGVVTAGVTPVTYTEALNMIGSLGQSYPEVAKFNLNLNAAPGDINTICEKWEALSIVSANDPANPNDYFLFIGNDNDFLTSGGRYLDATNTIQSYDAGLENDSIVLAYRVRMTGTDNQVPFVANSIPNQSATASLPYSFTFAAGTFVDPESQTLTYTASKADNTALPAWLSFNATTRTFSGTPAGSDAGSFAVKVTATDSGTPALFESTTFTVTVTATPIFSFASASYSVAEDSGNVTLVVNRTGDLAAASITLDTADGTALAGTDYTALVAFPVSFALNQSTQTVSVPVANRSGLNGARTFGVSLSGGTTTAPASTTVTITDVESSFAFAAATSTVSEAAGSATLAINRTGNTAGSVTVNVSTANGTAAAGTDYTALSSFPVSFAANQTSKTVSVSLISRAGYQGSRTFTATLQSAGGSSIVGAPATATITISEADIAGSYTTGPSSSATPYIIPTVGNWQVTSLLSVGDQVPVAANAGNTPVVNTNKYQMAGIPDGVGAYDNGDGTFTMLVNHELGNTLGTTRAHGSVGAFVSEFIIDKSTLAVLSGSDLIREVYGWDKASQTSNTTTGTFAFNRFCSADLPAVSAFYNAASGKGTQERIFMNGEESGTNGFALANVATGANKGKSYILGKFNRATASASAVTADGVGGWENLLANPFAQDKTVVIGNNDGGTGIMSNSVAVYVGDKQTTGTEADKAGLTNGVVKFVNVTGNTAEIANTTTRATNITNGTAFTLSTTSSTTFSRPEDGAWDPSNPSRFYFVTTDRIDQVNDQIGSQIGRTRLWRLNFTDLTNPDLGGTIDLLIEGGNTSGSQANGRPANVANMFDNMTVTTDGKILLCEDVGGAAHNGKVWHFDPVTGVLTQIFKHDPARFGDLVGGVTTPATAPFTNDEETSGVIEVTSIFGGNTRVGDRYYLIVDQAHYTAGIATANVEGGQLLLLHETASVAGPSTTQTPYIVPTDSAYRVTSLLSVGDQVPVTANAGNTPVVNTNKYQMAGIPDGVGAYDNGDGTFTMLVNHELGNTLGTTRAHGSVGAFVSEFIIDKNTLAVVSGSDLIREVYGWDKASQATSTTMGTFAFNRFCSADLPPVSAFYNAASGKGTQERIFMNGEESGTNGFALANVATGANKGKSYILGKFNRATASASAVTADGVGGWENLLVNPFAQDKTVVIGNNDGGTGIMSNSVAVYVGDKQTTGTEADKAGLTNGVVKFVNVTGNTAEIANTTTRATNITNGTAFTLSATSSTTFSRPEDGAWDPSNPSWFYFVTTDRIDQVNDQIGSQIGRTRLWRLNFTDITNPDLGGTIDLLIEGGNTSGSQANGRPGNVANMFDNMTVTTDGKILLCEDVGGAAHNGKVWHFDPVTGVLTQIFKHDPARFGDLVGGVTTPATAPFTNDEETSGVIDVSSIFGANAAAGEHTYLIVDQAHYTTGIATANVEGGQLLLIQHKPNAAFSLAAASTSVLEDAGTVSLTVNRYGDLQYAASVSASTVNGTATAGADFTVVSTTVNFAAGETSKTVSVPVLNRSGLQGSRTFQVALGSPSAKGYLGAPNVASITITDVNVGSVYTIPQATYSVSEAVGTLQIDVTRTGATDPADLTVTTTNGSAVAGVDFTAPASVLHFSDGDTTATISVPITNLAGSPQGTRSFSVTLSGATSPGSILNASVTVTINEAEGSGGVIAFGTYPANKLVVAPVNATAQPNTVAVTVSRSVTSAGTVSATITAGPVSPTPVSPLVALNNTTDYLLAGNTLSVSFGPGETSKTVEIPLRPTVRNGQFKLTLGSATGTGASIGTPSTLTVEVAKKDTTAPTLTVTFTPNLTAGTLAYAGTAVDGGTLSTGINRVEVSLVNVSNLGTPATATLSGATNAFSGSANLSQGINKLTITAYDNSGNKSAKSTTVTYSSAAITSLAGTYNGLVTAATGVTPSMDNTGYIAVSATSGAVVSGKLTISGVTVPFSGQLDLDNKVYFKGLGASELPIIDKTDFETYLGSLSITIGSTGATAVLKTSAVGTVLAQGSAARQAAAANAGLLTAGAAQKYTIVFPSQSPQTGLQSADYPQGDGFATATVKPNGSVSLAGVQADGTAFTAAGFLTEATSTTQSVAILSPLYRKAGVFVSKVAFDLAQATNPDWDVTANGSLWIRPALPRSRYYRNGWPNGIVTDGVGARYTVTAGSSVLKNLTSATTNAQLQLDAGNLNSGVTRDLAITTTNGFVNKSTDTALKVTIATGTGAFKGTFTNEVDHTVNSFQGIILQEGANAKGFGFFLTTPAAAYDATGLSGGVSLVPHP